MQSLRNNITYLLFTLFLIIGGKSHAQDKKQALEDSKKKIEDEIAYTNKLLLETRKTKQLNVNELSLLQTKIRKRENLVSTIQQQLMQLDAQIKHTTAEVRKLEAELSLLRKEYANIISFAYKNRSGLNKLMFLFAADDFNQAYRRLKYLQQYSLLRQEQISKIDSTQQQMEVKRKLLESERQEKQVLFEAEKQQRDMLSNEKKGVDQELKKIGQQERKLQQTLRRQEQEARKLQQEIEAIIAEEIRRARKQEGAEASPDRLMNLTPEEKQLSDNFNQNKGKLPWPVERGVISGRFGMQPHPVLKKVTINNRGIDISTTKGSDARAVFDGIVVSTNRITATNNAVILRHGDYFTVYSNLEKIYVKRGDNITTKQALGLIHTENIEGKTLLHFELWKDRTLVDPALWLAK